MCRRRGPGPRFRGELGQEISRPRNDLELAGSTSGRGLFWAVTDRFELEAVRIEPVGRVTMLPVLREFVWFVENDGPAGTGPLVGLPDDRSVGDEEPDVMKARVSA